MGFMAFPFHFSHQSGGGMGEKIRDEGHGVKGGMKKVKLSIYSNHYTSSVLI